MLDFLRRGTSHGTIAAVTPGPQRKEESATVRASMSCLAASHLE